MTRVAIADMRRIFEKPVAGENYVLYPLHFQPGATTLVQAPLYVDQLALLRDMAASLPVGYRLYVKEHVSSRGRRPIEFYEGIRAIPAARLLRPDEDTWTLIRDARVVAVITGTVGWEGLLFDKPIVTFGDVFLNLHPSVYRAGDIAKDRWYDVFQQATTRHEHDREAVLAMIAALQQASYPGFIANPSTFPRRWYPRTSRCSPTRYRKPSEFGVDAPKTAAHSHRSWRCRQPRAGGSTQCRGTCGVSSRPKRIGGSHSGCASCGSLQRWRRDEALGEISLPRCRPS